MKDLFFVRLVMDSWLPHVHTKAAFDLSEQAKDARRFWIPDILWILQPLFYKWDRLNSTPTAECIAGHIQTRCSPSAKDLACVVHVRLCTCVFTQECGFVLYPPSVAFLWGIFPDSFPCCYEKPNTSCFLDRSERSPRLWNTPVSSVRQNHK